MTPAKWRFCKYVLSEGDCANYREGERDKRGRQRKESLNVAQFRDRESVPRRSPPCDYRDIVILNFPEPGIFHRAASFCRKTFGTH